MTEVINEEKEPTLREALIEFKRKKLKITKGTENKFYKSNYADLTTILDTIESDLTELGVIVSSHSRRDGDGWILQTTIQHKDDDDKIVSSFPIFGSKPQEFGSSITYARRYNLQSLLNLTAEDDDGNSANEAKPMGAKKEEPQMMTGQEFLDLQERVRKCETGSAFEQVKAEAKSKWKQMLPAQQENITKAIQAKDEEFDQIPEFGGK